MIDFPAESKDGRAVLCGTGRRLFLTDPGTEPILELLV